MCEVEWCGEDKGVVAGDRLKWSLPGAGDAQPATVLQPCTTLAGPTHKEGSTCSHPWDTEASPQIPFTYKQANVLICNQHK